MYATTAESCAVATPSTNIQRQFPRIPVECVPPGLEALYSALIKLYPTQRNPLQMVAVKKYWLGGPDPVDYVNMYFNPGNYEQRIPPHWHYVTMGLSDLHGDGRVHEPKNSPTQSSGFGFELTFRLKKVDSDVKPPTWPGAMLQQLARNVFAGSKFYVGDSVPWHVPLDGDADSRSRIRHLLLAEDAQLAPLQTPTGCVNFIQVVGVCGEELKAAQRWNGRGLLHLLRQNPHTGGDLLVTDVARGATIFEMDFKARDALDRGVATEGSSLIGVNARCNWLEWHAVGGPVDWRMQQHYDQPINNNSNVGCQSNTTPYRGIEITLNFEAALMLPMMLKSRLAHERHFSFTNTPQNKSITFVPPNVAAIVNPQSPYAAWGNWLQVYVGLDLQRQMQIELAELDDVDVEQKLTLPKSYEWPNYRLKIVVTPESAV